MKMKKKNQFRDKHVAHFCSILALFFLRCTFFCRFHLYNEVSHCRAIIVRLRMNTKGGKDVNYKILITFSHLLHTICHVIKKDLISVEELKTTNWKVRFTIG